MPDLLPGLQILGMGFNAVRNSFATGDMNENLENLKTKGKKTVKYRPNILSEICKEDTLLLRNWVEKNGGDFSRVCVGKNLKGERGLYSLQKVKQGETILEVPEKCLIKPHLFQQHPDMNSMCTRELFETSSKFESVICPLALFIVLESRKQESSFAPYLDTLPEDFTIPGFEDNIDHRVENEHMLQHLEQLRIKIEAFRQHCIENDIDISAKEWLRVCSLVQSRSFFHKQFNKEALNLLKRKANLNYDPFFTMLFPVGDMANHSDDPCIKVDAENGTLTAIRDIETKEELVFDYMPHEIDEDHFYLYYGLPRIKKGWTKVDLSFD